MGNSEANTNYNYFEKHHSDLIVGRMFEKLHKALYEEGPLVADGILASSQFMTPEGLEELLRKTIEYREVNAISNEYSVVVTDQQFTLWICSKMKGNLCPTTAWGVAVKAQSLEIVHTLINAGATTKDSTTFLALCAEQPPSKLRDDIFTLLCTYSKGNRPLLEAALFAAIKSDDKTLVKILLGNGVSPNAYHPGLNRKAIHHAYRTGKCLGTLYKAGAKVTEEDLLLATCAPDSKALVKLLSFHVVSPSTKTLMEAVVVNNPHCILALSKAGVCVDTPESHSAWGVDWIPSRLALQPLFVAILLEKGPSAQALLECGASWPKPGSKTLDWGPMALVHLCCSTVPQSDYLIQSLLAVRPDIVDTPAQWRFAEKNTMTPLASAALFGRAERITFLIGKGAQVNDQEKPEVRVFSLQIALYWSLPQHSSAYRLVQNSPTLVVAEKCG
ncbi:hypothetical protein Pelo_13012 [Pelomyxa schiedti]|nr:hypothetical protein Pelo_13012 [Pelomyxa schiedti]